MSQDRPAKVQHYVPQFLLRSFATGKKHRLQVFDKQAGRSFATVTRNVAAESRFYDFEVGGQVLSLDRASPHLKAKSAPSSPACSLPIPWPY